MDTMLATFNCYGVEIDSPRDINGFITHLFVAHPKNVDLLWNNCDILLVDFTYKSRKTQFSLLLVVTDTMLYSMFLAAFVVTKNEDNNSYMIAITFIRRLLQIIILINQIYFGIHPTLHLTY